MPHIGTAKTAYSAAARRPPRIGPITGIQAYDQPLSRLPVMGRRAWAMRGPRSRAGLIAYPVVPPKEINLAVRRKTEFERNPATHTHEDTTDD